jgi:hypothetical protein
MTLGLFAKKCSKYWNGLAYREWLKLLLNIIISSIPETYPSEASCYAPLSRIACSQILDLIPTNTLAYSAEKEYKTVDVENLNLLFFVIVLKPNKLERLSLLSLFSLVYYLRVEP